MEQQLGIKSAAYAFLAAFAVVAGAACGQGAPAPPSNRPSHRLLANLKAPPLNAPASFFGIVPVEGGTSLPPGDEPALVFLSEGRQVRAVGAVSGHLSVGDGRLTLKGRTQRPVEVLFRLPTGLAAPVASETAGNLTNSEAGSPDNAARHFVVRREGSLLLAQISLSSAKPVVAALGAGLRIVQTPTTPETPGQPGGVQVEAFDGEQPLGTIPPATPKELRTRSGILQAFVRTSTVTSLPGAADKPDVRYVLNAWVVRSEK